MSRLKANLRRFRLMAAGLSSFKKWWAGIEVSHALVMDSWISHNGTRIRGLVIMAHGFMD